jgi:hypothetical protein
MSLIRKAVLTPHTLPWLLTSRREIDKLRTISDEPSRLLADALGAALDDRLTTRERAWVDSIEALRKRADASKQLIRMEDFGAGSPTANLSAAEMYRGRFIEKTLGAFSHASKPYLWTSVLFHLVRKFQPETIIELGCCVGISASYQAAAQKLNERGRLWTLEGASELAAVARGHFAELALDNVTVVPGRFQDTLNGVIAEAAPVDYAFIDGHHDEQATLDYFEQLLPHLAPRALLVFDDVDWSDGMKRAWQKIQADPRVAISIETRTLGLCVIDSTISKRNWRIPMA